jgi:23S rRNA (uridine2552-2'-O)-methyltransferase
VAAEVVGPEGRVVGVDRTAPDPLELAHVRVLVADLGEPGTAERIVEALGGPADVVLCDAAPKLTGVRATDRANEEALLGAVERLLPAVLRAGGSLLLKLLEAPEAVEVARRIGARFASARTTRPAATRRGSGEKYLVAREFRP